MDSCLKKQASLKALFKHFPSKEEKYQKIISLGKDLPKLPSELKQEYNLVIGCQSLLYLATSIEDDHLHFKADSDALISKGLAALLIHIYDDESTETILKCPPTVLIELEISQLLSPNRANGLSGLYKRIQSEAVNALK